PDLINDLETIRQHLGIDRWAVFGGSWGSTLGLAYAQDYPGRVLGLILRGVFLGRQRDLDWFIGPDGAARLFPDYYADFTAAVAPRTDLADAFHERMFGANELQARQAATAWTLWESRIATLLPNPFFTKRFAASKAGQIMAKIECHYFRDACGLADRPILVRADALANIPGIIVQGRQDVVCPPDGAVALNKAWPNSQLQLIPGAAHSASEAPLIDALVRATDQFARL
ncbi:MAG: alpha/beta fold hydrolase, partial [Litorivicinus sp.]